MATNVSLACSTVHDFQLLGAIRLNRMNSGVLGATGRALVERTRIE